MNKELILDFMNKRMEALRERIERDYGGNLVGYNETFREVKYWKEAIERGEFDEKTE
jgi:phage head maturation protease